MELLELYEKISKGENLHTEFKEILPDNETLARAIVCFANTDGGQIIIGISDKKKMVGLESSDAGLLRIDDVAFNRCEPPITILAETIKVEDKTILIVNVPRGTQRPYRTKSGVYYIRSGNRCRQASWEEVRRLYQTSESIYFDECPIPQSAITDIDLDYFKSFVKKYIGLATEEGLLENYMLNLKILTEEKKPTVAGMLFFGKKPQIFMPESKIITAYISGKDISIPPSDKKDIIGKIEEIIDSTIKFLRLYLKQTHRIEGFKPEIYPEIPEDVLREGLVNAIAHRDYTIMASIRLFIFEDRVEIITPGKLPDSVTLESMKIGVSHTLRNPKIYNFLYKIGMVTDLGSGVYRMMKKMKDLGREIELLLTENEFIVKIPRGVK
ncbi:MAG: putative DNA binding domain-containing protein [bacterium]|nr:putative DNA binding domain-containing protein [bacterium]